MKTRAWLLASGRPYGLMLTLTCRNEIQAEDLLMKETQCLCIGGVFDVTMNSTLKDT